MKEKLSWFDRIMAAVTFAEANVPEAGKEFLTGTVLKSEREEIHQESDVLLSNDLSGAEASS